MALAGCHVDPRVTPMGYPVYLSAPTPPGSVIALQRLVMAQVTGGAIRGAIRADFFWGYGTAAGHQAMRTRKRGQMWLMLPRSEAAQLHGSALGDPRPAVRSRRSGQRHAMPDCRRDVFAPKSIELDRRKTAHFCSVRIHFTCPVPYGPCWRASVGGSITGVQQHN